MELWERFTSHARRAALRAHSEAMQMQVPHIGAEHLLSGLLGLQEGTATEVLAELGTNMERLRADLAHEVETGAATEVGQEVAFAPEVQRVLPLAYTEAKALGHRQAGTEHILLGIL